jgi:hypothetical protein
VKTVSSSSLDSPKKRRPDPKTISKNPKFDHDRKEANIRRNTNLRKRIPNYSKPHYSKIQENDNEKHYLFTDKAY